MAVSTVNISFQDKLLTQIDQTAYDEARTRSELIREAVRIYIDRKKDWEILFQTGAKIGSTIKISEKDVMSEVKRYRKQKAR